jgi:hypothetical protein
MEPPYPTTSLVTINVRHKLVEITKKVFLPRQDNVPVVVPIEPDRDVFFLTRCH